MAYLIDRGIKNYHYNFLLDQTKCVNPISNPKEALIEGIRIAQLETSFVERSHGYKSGSILGPSCCFVEVDEIVDDVPAVWRIAVSLSNSNPLHMAIRMTACRRVLSREW